MANMTGTEALWQLAKITKNARLRKLYLRQRERMMR